MHRRRTKVARLIDRKAMERAGGLQTSMLESYLPNILMTLGVSADAFLYHDGPMEDVQVSLEALNAVWSELEARRQTVPLTIEADSV